MNFLIINIGKLTKKFDSLSFLQKILFGYISISAPFLYYHEKHLPILAILALIFSTLVISILTFLIFIQVLKFLFKNEFHPVFEIFYFGIGIYLVYLFGFFDNQAGIIFLFFIVCIFLFYRVLKLRVYYQIILIGVSIFINGLLSFKYLQYSEIFLFNKSLESKYSNEKKDFSNWELDEKTNIATNKDVPIQILKPEGFYFHNPKDLKQDESTGTGQILGIITDSIKVNSYPQIRLFYVEALVNVELDILKDEFEKILNFEKSQGQMEEIKYLGENEFEKKWKGHFWTFYDVIRPRYSKTGFYLLKLNDGASVVITVTENLVEKEYHEEKILEMLNSIKVEF